MLDLARGAWEVAVAAQVALKVLVQTGAIGILPFSSRPCFQDANHLSHPVRLREDDPAGDGLHPLGIACHVQDGQIGKALAVGLGHRPAIGSRQANVGQQGIDGDPGVQEVSGPPRRWPLQ